MALAIGGASTRPAQGVLTVNVLDHGANASGAFDNSSAFQAAVDAAAAKLAADGSDRKGVVLIPSSTGIYLLKNPVWVDHPNVEIRGDGLGSVVSIYGSYACPAFIFGIPRGSGTAAQVDPSYRPDLYPLFDVWAAYIPGIRWGYRTKGTSCLQFISSVLAEGVDRWSGSPTYTLEFCVAPTAGGEMPPGFLMGVGIPSYPNPWAISLQGTNTYSVNFRTADQPDYQGGTAYQFSFSSGTATGPQKIALQWNFIVGKFTAYVNGTQVAVSGGGTFPAGLQFATNEYWAFQFGGNQGDAQVEPGPGGSAGLDLILYGLLLSAQLRYLDNGAGQPQARINGQPTTDGYRWFGKEHDNSLSTDYLGYLPFNNDPSQMDRLVPVAELAGPTTVGWIHSAELLSGTYGNAIRDVIIEGANNRSQNIVLGSVIAFTAERVQSFGAFHAIGSLHLGAAYKIVLRDCILAGSDSGYFGYYQGMAADHVTFTGSGRTTVKMVGSGSTWSNVFIQGSSGCQSLFALHPAIYGGSHRITTVGADFEGDSVGRAAIYCANHPFSPATLTVEDVYLGTAANASCAVMLCDSGPLGLYQRAWASIRNVQTFGGSPAAYLTVDGPLWNGEVSGLPDTPGPRIAHLGTWGSTTGMAICDTKFAGPPRQDYWYKGVHILDIRSSADGQYTQWRCVATGQYGTSTPPVWAGVSPAASSLSALAASITNHAYITCSIAP